MAALKKVEERLAKLESSVGNLMQKLVTIEAALDTTRFDTLKNRVDEIASKQSATEMVIKDRMKETTTDNEIRLESSELRCEERMSVINARCKEMADKALAMEIKLQELNTEWPTLTDSFKLVESKRNKSQKQNNAKLSFAEKYKDKGKDTIVLVGDSLARGVGHKLEHQSNMVSTVSKPGAGIEHISKEIRALPENDDRHLVLLVGTNDLKTTGSEVLLAKYKSMLEDSKKVKNRIISVVGIPKRLDLTNFHNSRRIGVNRRLEEMCAKMEIEYISYEPEENKFAPDELHLNHSGQDELAAKIFRHCRYFLV